MPDLILVQKRFISAEPLLGPIDLGFDHECGDPPHCPCPPMTDWLIIGGESGGRARAMQMEWVRDLLAQCHEPEVSTVPFMKQLGAVLGREMGGWPQGRRHGEVAGRPAHPRVPRRAAGAMGIGLAVTRGGGDHAVSAVSAEADPGELRHCLRTDCQASFNIVAVYRGEARADGWRLVRATGAGYLCPSHAGPCISGEHLPDWLDRDAPAGLTGIRCACGWRWKPDVPSNAGQHHEQWTAHLIDATAGLPRRIVTGYDDKGFAEPGDDCPGCGAGRADHQRAGRH